MDNGPSVVRAQDELFSRRKKPGKAICKQHHEMRRFGSMLQRTRNTKIKMMHWWSGRLLTGKALATQA